MGYNKHIIPNPLDDINLRPGKILGGRDQVGEHISGLLSTNIDITDVFKYLITEENTQNVENAKNPSTNTIQDIIKVFGETHEKQKEYITHPNVAIVKDYLDRAIESQEKISLSLRNLLKESELKADKMIDNTKRVLMYSQKNDFNTMDETKLLIDEIVHISKHIELQQKNAINLIIAYITGSYHPKNTIHFFPRKIKLNIDDNHTEALVYKYDNTLVGFLITMRLIVDIISGRPENYQKNPVTYISNTSTNNTEGTQLINTFLGSTYINGVLYKNDTESIVPYNANTNTSDESRIYLGFISPVKDISYKATQESYEKIGTLLSEKIQILDLMQDSGELPHGKPTDIIKYLQGDYVDYQQYMTDHNIQISINPYYECVEKDDFQSGYQCVEISIPMTSTGSAKGIISNLLGRLFGL